MRNFQEQVKKIFCCQKVCEFSTFSLEFQKFFSITRAIFLTLGPKKIPVFENNSRLYKFLRFEVALTSEVIGILAKCLLRQMQSHANRSVQCEWTTLAVWQVTTYLSRWANNGWLETLSKKIGLMLAKEFVMEGFWPAERGLCFQKFLLLSHMPRTVLAFAYAYCILRAVHTTLTVKFVLNSMLSNLSNGRQLQI
jgi:hypothetical protein